MKDIVIRSLTTAFAAALCVCAFTACSAEDAVDEAVPPATSNTTTSAEPVVDSIAEVVTTAATESTVLDTQPVSESNPIPESTPSTEDTKPSTQTPAEDTPTKPAAGDIKNPDGTYTQDFSSGKYTIPECVEGTIQQEWFEVTDRKSNPSKIPYSEITVENAVEAFPYTGWIGKSQVTLDNGAVVETGPDMSPGYIEVFPTDDIETIEWKIRANTVGTADTQFNYNLEDMNGEAVFERPHHFFASEADYKEFLAEWKRQCDDYDRRSEQGRDDNIDILGDLTEEDNEDLNDLLDSILGNS